MNKRVMVVDDEASIRISLEEGLKDFEYEVETVSSIEAARTSLLSFRPQLLILDVRLKDGDGIDFIDHVKSIDKDIEVIVMTAYGDIQKAVDAMKKGALEFVTKPFDMDEIEVLVKRAFEGIYKNQRLLIYENRHEMEKGKESILTQNEGMKSLLLQAKKVAMQDSVTVLITGETGTGKELMADYIHNNSVRRKTPMVKINCAAIPKDLFESELFGHEKSAFTGANQLKKGMFEIADGGTVFLDEIGEIPLEQQAKLLRFLENRILKRVGGLQGISVNVRVIAATNRNLLEMVNKGLFRADLYYRINVVPINIRALRERREDILYLAEHFRGHYNQKFNKALLGFSEEASELMMAYSWPGNVRELKNLIERACIIQDEGAIKLSEFPSGVQSDLTSGYSFDFLKWLERGQAIDLTEHLTTLENECIDKALEICHGNQSKAAELLNISRFALKRRLEKQS